MFWTHDERRTGLGGERETGRLGEGEIEERSDEPTEGSSPNANSAKRNWEIKV